MQLDYDRALIAMIGDLHINSTVALCKPIVPLDDGGAYTASPLQRWIFSRYVEYLQLVKAARKKLGWPLVTIVAGEAADNLKYPSTQLITKDEATLFMHAVELLEPLASMSDHLIMLRGTEAHSGVGSSLDSMVGHDLGAEQDADGAYSFYRFRGSVAGVQIDAAHHPGKATRIENTSGSEAIRLAADVMLEYARVNAGLALQGDDPLPIPQLVMRGHNHKPADSYNNQPIRAIILPSWQATNAFGYKIGGSVLPIGAALGLARRVKGRKVGELEVKHFRRYFPLAPRQWYPQGPSEGTQAH